MPWSLIVTLIVELMPYLLKWLEELFDKTSKSMGVVPATHEVFRLELEEFFRRARDSVPWYKWWRRSIVDRVEKVIMARSGEFHLAMLSGDKSFLTPLSNAENEDLRYIMGV